LDFSARSIGVCRLQNWVGSASYLHDDVMSR
jgi:hypothetical protein